MPLSGLLLLTEHGGSTFGSAGDKRGNPHRGSTLPIANAHRSPPPAAAPCVRWGKRKGRMEGHKRDRARIVNASARENGAVGRHSLPGRVPNGRPGAGDALLSLRFMEFRPWLCANSERSCCTFVAGVRVVLINALWYVLNSGEKKVCTIIGSTCSHSTVKKNHHEIFIFFKERNQTCFLSPSSCNLVVGKQQSLDLAKGIPKLETRGENGFVAFNWKKS